MHSKSDIERFWSRVDKRTPIECWEWKGTMQSTGYGVMHVEGKPVGAHRISYEIHNGPIPKRHFICHACDNPSCVNPYHLWAGTQKENLDDMRSKGRQQYGYGETNSAAKLCESDVINIRDEYAQGDVLQRELAEKYGVDRTAISMIVNRHRWKHIP